MKKIGILGGTLDPIHNGHLMIAECARDQLSLDEVWFMPTGNPPHKSNQNISPNEVRKEMIELAIEDNNNFKFSDFEYKRDGIIYTSDTMKLLKNAYKDTAGSARSGWTVPAPGSSPGTASPAGRRSPQRPPRCGPMGRNSPASAGLP